MNMSANEQLWFAVGISGLVIFIEATITWFGIRLFKNPGHNILKLSSGFAILVIAIIMLFQVA